MRLSRALRSTCVLLAGVAAVDVDTAMAQSFAERADALLVGYHAAGLLNGSVLVAKGDSVLYERGFGEADMAWHVPNSPSTKFRIASATKQFTAALVHQLAEQGLIDLDAPISNTCPTAPPRRGGGSRRGISSPRLRASRTTRAFRSGRTSSATPSRRTRS